MRTLMSEITGGRGKSAVKRAVYADRILLTSCGELVELSMNSEQLERDKASRVWSSEEISVNRLTRNKLQNLAGHLLCMQHRMLKCQLEWKGW